MFGFCEFGASLYTFVIKKSLMDEFGAACLNCEIVLSNASAQAIRKAQKAFAGAAEEMGVFGEEDVQALVDEVRYGRDG